MPGKGTKIRLKVLNLLIKQLNDYPNMNVIELSKVIILNYGYGINIIWQK